MKLHSATHIPLRVTHGLSPKKNTMDEFERALEYMEENPDASFEEAYTAPLR